MAAKVLDCDVVVVGSGGGALTGAYAAATHGLATVVLEKTDLLGGTTAYSGGGLFLPGNQAEARASIADSMERGRTYLRAVLGSDDDPRREAFLVTAPQLVEFLERHPALKFQPGDARWTMGPAVPSGQHQRIGYGANIPRAGQPDRHRHGLRLPRRHAHGREVTGHLGPVRNS